MRPEVEALLEATKTLSYQNMRTVKTMFGGTSYEVVPLSQVRVSFSSSTTHEAKVIVNGVQLYLEGEERFKLKDILDEFFAQENKAWQQSSKERCEKDKTSALAFLKKALL